MPVQLNAASRNLPVYNPHDKVELANTELHKLSTHIAARAQGSKWPGYLKLVSDPNSNTMSVERNRWFSGKSKPTADDNQATAAYLKDLFRVAYGSRCSPAQYEKIMQDVENYLDINNSKIGTRHLVSFVRAFDTAAAQYPVNQAPFTASPLPSPVADKLAASLIDDGASPDSVTEQHKEGLEQLFGVESNKIKPLGSGAEGSAYSVWADGKPVVYKAFTKHEPITLQTLRKGEVGAARLRGVPHVANPADLMVRRNDGMVYRVPANEMKSFARQQLAGAGTSLRLIGSVMPRAVGKPLDALIGKNPLNQQDFSAFSKGLFDGLQELHARGAVHHDIKPANVLFDAATGATTVIDMGGIDKLSKKEGPLQQSSRFIGTQFYFHPKFEATGLNGLEYVANQHGAEVDRYAFGLTLLASLEHTINDRDFVSLAMTNVIPPDTPANCYLEGTLNLLKRYSPEGSARLAQRLAQNPAIQQLLEDSFAASEGGPAADALWQGIRNNPLFVAIDTERAEAKQTFEQKKIELTSAASLPAADNSEFYASPQRVEVKQGSLVPQQGFFRAGKLARDDVSNLLQAEVNQMAAASNAGARSSWVLLANNANDPDLKQLRLDITRADYSVNNVPLLQNQGTAPERINALKSGIGNLLEGQPDPAQQSEWSTKAFMELAGLLHQGTTLTLGASSVSYLNGLPETKKPWHGALFDHPNFNIKPDSDQPGALLIECVSSQKPGVVFINNAQLITGKTGNSAYDFDDTLNLTLRYTPSPDLTQPGTIAVLDLQSQFAWKEVG